MKKVFFALAGVLIYIIGIGIYFSNRVMFMKKKEVEFIKNREITAKRLNPQDFAGLPKMESWVNSPSGYRLKCIFIEPHESNKWVIICHGVTENKVNSIKYSSIFLERGFNTVIYDHRRHGESGGKTSSYGHYEKFDLQAVIAELKKQKGDDLLIGIHGESMGAATLLLYAGMIDDGADFYIADCPFSNFDEQLQYQITKEIPLPAWTVLPIGRAFIKLRDHYWTSEISPIDFVHNIKKPVLFIHSQNDSFIPASMTVDLFEKKQGPKQLYLAVKGAHAQSYNENRKEYEQVIDDFLDKYVLANNEKTAL